MLMHIRPNTRSLYLVHSASNSPQGRSPVSSILGLDSCTKPYTWHADTSRHIIEVDDTSNVRRRGLWAPKYPFIRLHHSIPFVILWLHGTKYSEQILRDNQAMTGSGAGSNLKVEGHKIPALASAEKFWCAPPLFCGAPPGERALQKIGWHGRETRVYLQVWLWDVQYIHLYSPSRW